MYYLNTYLLRIILLKNKITSRVHSISLVIFLLDYCLCEFFYTYFWILYTCIYSQLEYQCVTISLVVESGTETLRICLKIIEAYLLLCPQQFMHVSTILQRENYITDMYRCFKFQFISLQHFCNSLASSLHGLVSNIREDGQILILRVSAPMRPVRG